VGVHVYVCVCCVGVWVRGNVGGWLGGGK